MDFSIHIDAIRIGLPILYFKGSQVEVSRLLCFSAFHLGLHCLPKYPFRGFQ